MAITLVTPREYKLLKQIERETKVAMDVREVPSLEDVAERQAEMWRNRVLDVLREGGLGQYRAILGGLVDEHDPIDIASALLKLLSSGDGTRAEGDDYDFGDTGARPGMVRFFVNIGRTARMSPADFVRAISEEAGVPGEAVGRIDMFEKFTFIEVEQDSAPFVYEALRQSRINGTRVNLE
ncbi:hypothetical protein GCM10025858_35970 [Alicyclobacillus sacchari]|nr:hypothetical protein GCM10025858_35970 [Alicyclobacillus sacchari]